jgi:mRNA-degrading endonuclease YafQ of YafQ-DinJ toxin-antitoxin module
MDAVKEIEKVKTGIDAGYVCHHYNMSAIYDIIAAIIWREPLPERCRPHGLHGDPEGFTECHAQPVK